MDQDYLIQIAPELQEQILLEINDCGSFLATLDLINLNKRRNEEQEFNKDDLIDRWLNFYMGRDITNTLKRLMCINDYGEFIKYLERLDKTQDEPIDFVTIVDNWLGANNARRVSLTDYIKTLIGELKATKYLSGIDLYQLIYFFVYKRFDIEDEDPRVFIAINFDCFLPGNDVYKELYAQFFRWNDGAITLKYWMNEGADEYGDELHFDELNHRNILQKLQDDRCTGEVDFTILFDSDDIIIENVTFVN